MNTDSWISNADLIQYTQIPANIPSYNESRVKPRESCNISIPAYDFKLILDDIGKFRHRLNDKQKQFAFTFISSIINKPSISHKQCKVLRDIQKQCCPNYLKSPKAWI